MMESRTWPVAASTKQVSQVDLWRPLLDAVSWFEHAKVYIISGEHPDGDTLRYEAIGGVEAMARAKTGERGWLPGETKPPWARARATPGRRRLDQQSARGDTGGVAWMPAP